MKKKIRQQEFGFVNWGGKRRGAGRKPSGERAGVPHVKRAKLAARNPVLVTMRLCSGLRTLRARDVNALIRAAVAAGRREDFRVVEYSLQETHIHALVEASDERSLSSSMNGLATRIARGLNALWRRTGRAFAPDVYSSASFFDGWKGPIEKGAESRAALLERARTWLLSVGWRRHGLIDPLEVPVGAEVWM